MFRKCIFYLDLTGSVLNQVTRDNYNNNNKKKRLLCVNQKCDQPFLTCGSIVQGSSIIPPIPLHSRSSFTTSSSTGSKGFQAVKKVQLIFQRWQKRPADNPLSKVGRSKQKHVIAAILPIKTNKSLQYVGEGGVVWMRVLCVWQAVSASCSVKCQRCQHHLMLWNLIPPPPLSPPPCCSTSPISASYIRSNRGENNNQCESALGMM